MNKYFSLTKTLLGSGGDTLFKRNTKSYKKILLLLLIAVSLTPMAIGIGFMTMQVYDALVPISQQGFVLAIAFSLIVMVIFVFGIFYSLSVFYFTKDIESLLPLPIPPQTIIAGKLTVTVIYEYLTELMFMLPVLVGYGISSHAGVLYYIYSLIIFLTLPIIPLLISTMLAMTAMRFTNIGKNKDMFKIISGIALMFIIFSFNIIMNNSASGSLKNADTLRNVVLQGNNSLIGLLSNRTINAKLAALALANINSISGFGNLILYLVLTSALTALFIASTGGFYLKGVVGIGESSSKSRKLSNEEFEKSTGRLSTVNSLLLKEIRLLVRTPIYFMNCVMMNFLWPLFIIVPMFFQPNKTEVLAAIKSMIVSPGIQSTVLVVAFGISIVITATNCITSTCISREGQNLFFMKYIPVSFKKQLTAKLLSGMFFGAIGTLLMLICFVVFAFPQPLTLIYIILTSVLGISFACESGLIIDIYFPKLIWDNEQKAVKQNMNVLINMCIGFGAAFAAGFLIIKFSLDLNVTALGLMILFAAVDYVLYNIILTKGTKHLQNLEN